VLLCSDGLTRMIPDDGIAQVLAEAKSAQHAADRLVEIANDNGGEDNVTVIVARLKAPARSNAWQRLARLFSGGNRHGQAHSQV
jgi:PPM family protein phosphatase